MAILRRRPVLRAAAIGGGAYSAGWKRNVRKRLEYLAEQHERGVLSDEDFARHKAAALAEADQQDTSW
jgi:hypothetical protein